MKELPARKKNRLDGYDYSSAGCYFVTICVKDKHELLGKIDTNVGATVPGRPLILLSEIGDIVNAAFSYYAKHHPSIKIHHYVIMPNHIHAIVELTESDRGSFSSGDRGRSPLQYFVRSLKSYVTKQIGFSLWQRSFHDHIIRNKEDYQRIWQYINENPTHWAEDFYNM